VSALSTTPACIAVDWGSTNLRAWALDAHHVVLARTSSPRGMLSLSGPDAFEQALLETLEDWLPSDASGVEVIICGMAGARQGWQEAPYLKVEDTPSPLADQLVRRRVSVKVQDPRLEVSIIPGLCQSSPHFDVMRGEETQLAGLLGQQPEFTGSVCLPGTHTKWVHLDAGQITRFSTVMTGELFALLGRSSVLRHSVTPDSLDDARQRACFKDGVTSALARPAELSRELFTLRARDLLDPDLPADASRSLQLGARLSGLLIGLELAGHTLALPSLAPVVMIGSAELCQRYQLALECLPEKPASLLYTDLTLNGLTHLHQLCRASTQP